MKPLSRAEFLRLVGAASAGAAVLGLGGALRPGEADGAVGAETETSGGSLAVVGSSSALSVWTTCELDRVFPTTKPGTAQTVSIAAAGGEYQGVIIGLNGAMQRTAVVTWSSDTDPLLLGNSVLDQVAFVHITHPTTDLGSKPGWYPDPLLPRAFGQRLTVPSQSSSLYVLFHVPFGTTAGTYTGTLQVANGTEEVNLPVSLTVWNFGWQRLSVRTGFGVGFNDLGCDTTLAYDMLLQHGVCPLMPKLTADPTADGSIDQSRYADGLDPYLSGSGLAMPTARLPWVDWTPDYPWKFDAKSPDLLNYLTNVCRVYADNGWQKQAIAYPIDEPLNTATERKADALARTLHRASARSGFRCSFLLTDDPRPTSLGPLLPANKFLWDDVDIWCVRYYYFFGRVPVLRALQAKGKRVWWYPYYDSSVKELPSFVIDKSLADERIWGWLMYRWNVNGMLYWGVNRWGDALTGKGNRDPYQDPLSFEYPDGRVANGEACLIYPGYYPPYGLDQEGAAPVSSLRLEALRDGFEDMEYLQLATKLLGASYVRSIVAGITSFPYPVRYGHLFNFPKYTTSPSAYSAARAKLGRAIDDALAKAAAPMH